MPFLKYVFAVLSMKDEGKSMLCAEVGVATAV
jgi:hypothetical protein